MRRFAFRSYRPSEISFRGGGAIFGFFFVAGFSCGGIRVLGLRLAAMGEYASSFLVVRGGSGAASTEPSRLFQVFLLFQTVLEHFGQRTGAFLIRGVQSCPQRSQ